MAVGRILLLSGETEGPFLAAILRAHNARLQVDTLSTHEALAAACQEPLDGCRLVSFCSAVIVPDSVLRQLPGPAYNFHPGPPEFPGRYPSVFALYEGAERFGITVHEMAAKVDAGPIVAAEWFAIPSNCDLAKLEELAFAALVEKFRALSYHLAMIDRPMVRQPYRWGARKTKKADRDALCLITPDLDPTETARRRRACGLANV
jgi:methionyl-tRNA formyltransferase